MFEALIGATVALQLLVIFSDAEIEVRPVSVPWTLNAAGLTSEALTEAFRDELRIIVLNSNGTHETAPQGMIDSNLAEALAEVLHLEAPVHEMRNLLGQVTHEVSIEFFHLDNDLYLETRIITLPVGPALHEEHAVDRDRIFEALEEAARWVMRQVDPLTLTRLELEEAQESEQYTSVLQSVEISRRFYERDMYPLIDHLAGVAHLALGDANVAASFFRQTLRRDPDFAEAELNLAIALAALGEREEAQAIVDKLSKPPRLDFWGDRDPIRAAALTVQGLMAAHEGRLEEAVHHMRKGVALSPDMPVLHEFLAYALEDLGLSTLARFHVERAAHLTGKAIPPLSRARLDAEELRELLPPDTSGTRTSAMLRDDPDPASPTSGARFAQVHP
jgi:tetratricopeptide (TPR) repeat protein